MHVREIVGHLPCADDSRVSKIILRGSIHRRAGVGNLVERLGLPEDRIVAILPDDEFVGHRAGRGEAPVQREIARIAQRVHLANAAGEDRLAAVHHVAKAVVRAPRDATVDRAPRTDHLVDLDGLIVLPLGGLRAEGIAGGVESVADGEIVGQGLILHFRLNGGVEAEVLRVAGADVVGADAEAGQGIARRVDRSSGSAGGLITPAFHIPQNALTRGGRVHGARRAGAGARMQSLVFEKEKGLVLDHRAADAAAENILLQLRLADAIDVVLPFVGVEARRAVKPEAVPMEIVGAGARDHRNLAAAVAPRLGGIVAGEMRIRPSCLKVHAERGGVGAAWLESLTSIHRA